jgi:hypothetical protein
VIFTLTGFPQFSKSDIFLRRGAHPVIQATPDDDSLNFARTILSDDPPGWLRTPFCREEGKHPWSLKSTQFGLVDITQGYIDATTRDAANTRRTQTCGVFPANCLPIFENDYRRCRIDT